MNKKERFMALSLVLIFTIQIVSAMDLELILPGTKSPKREPYSPIIERKEPVAISRLMDESPIQETNKSVGFGSSIDITPPQFSVGEIEPEPQITAPFEYMESGSIQGDEAYTLGVNTYQDGLGFWRLMSDYDPKFQNRTTADWNNQTEEWENISERYFAYTGSFVSVFLPNKNMIFTRRFNFSQQPSQVGIFNWVTSEYTNLLTASLPSNIVLTEDEKSLVYENVYPDVHFNFTYDGFQLKEWIISNRTSYPNTPYPMVESYLTFATDLFDFEGLGGFNLEDDDGRISNDKIINGILRMTDNDSNILAYMPLGKAYSYFTGTGIVAEDVKNRLIKVGGVWKLVGGIRYGYVKHADRTGAIYIDPTWTIGINGNASWSTVDFVDCFENSTTNYAELNSTYYLSGNITSQVLEAPRTWKKIGFKGELNSQTVDIYWNSSSDNGSTDPFEMILVKTFAQPDTVYSLGDNNSEKYGSWHLVLATDTYGQHPIIYNVTIYNETPDVLWTEDCADESDWSFSSPINGVTITYDWEVDSPNLFRPPGYPSTEFWSQKSGTYTYAAIYRDISDLIETDEWLIETEIEWDNYQGAVNSYAGGIELNILNADKEFMVRITIQDGAGSTSQHRLRERGYYYDSGGTSQLILDYNAPTYDQDIINDGYFAIRNDGSNVQAWFPEVDVGTGTGYEEQWNTIADESTALQRGTMTYVILWAWTRWREPTECAYDSITVKYNEPNTPPTANYNLLGDLIQYAGNSYSFRTRHWDDDGFGDLRYVWGGFGPDTSNYIAFKCDPNSASSGTTTEEGNTDWTIGDATWERISAGSYAWDIEWYYTISWSVDYEDFVDYVFRSQDDALADTGWLSYDYDFQYLNDLEVESLTVSINGNYEYGGANGQIDDGDWFKGGEQVTASGTVIYEGSSKNFDSSYASAVDIELLYGGAGTGQADPSINSGVFSGITYTPTSGSNDLDITSGAYFDVRINDIPSSGSDMTATGIQKESKRDNEIPIMTSITVTGNDGAPVAEWDQNGVGFSIDFSLTLDGAGSGLPTLRWWVEVTNTPPDLYNTGTDPYTYPVDVGGSGTYTFYARPIDNVGNLGIVRNDNGKVDTTNPSIGTTEFQDEGYLSGTTGWYDQGVDDEATYRIPFTETNVYSITVVCTLDASDRASDAGIDQTTPFDSTITITGRSDTTQGITIEIKDKSGRTDTTRAGGDTTIGLDDTDPTLTDAMSAYSEGGDTGEMWGKLSTNTFYFSNTFDTDGTATFTATGTDGGSDVYGIDFGSWGGDNPSIDTDSPYQGEYTVNNADTTGSIAVIIYDNVGNSASGSITCTEDAAGPSVSVTWNFNANNYAIKSGSDYGRTNIDYTSVQDTVSGLTAVYLNAYDHSASAWKTSITIDSGLNGNTGDLDYQNKYRYYTDTGETGGTYLDDEYDNNQDYFYAFADDMVGNRGGATIIYVRLDRTIPPSGSVVMEGGVFYTSITNDNTPLLTGSGYSDSGSGVSDFNFAWRSSGGGWTYRGYSGTNTWSPSVTPQSTECDFAFRARDTVGNEGNWVYDNGNTVDISDPSFTNIGGSESSSYLFAPSATTDYGYYSDNMGATLTDFNVIGDVTDNFGLEKADGTTHFSDTPSDSSITSTSDAFILTYTINNGDQGSGTEVVTVTLYDRAGNYVTDQFTFYEDNIIPSLSITWNFVANDYAVKSGSDYGWTNIDIDSTQDTISGLSGVYIQAYDHSDGSPWQAWRTVDTFTGDTDEKEYLDEYLYYTDNGETTGNYLDDEYDTNQDFYRIVSYDMVGNYLSILRYTRLDRTAATFGSADHPQDPDSNADGYLPQQYYEDDNTGTISFASCSDGGSGIQYYYVKSNEQGSYGSGNTDPWAQCTLIIDTSNNIYYKITDAVGNEVTGDTTINLYYGITAPTGFDMDISGAIGYPTDYIWISDPTDITSGTLYYNNGQSDIWSTTVDADGSADWESGGAWMVSFEAGFGASEKNDTTSTYDSNNYQISGASDTSIWIDIVNNCGISTRMTLTTTNDVSSPTITTTAESESSDYLYSGYGTVKQGFYGSQMGSGQSYTVSGTGSDGSSGMSNTVNDNTGFGGNPSNSGSGTSWQFIYSITSGDNGDITVTYTGYDHVGNSDTDIYDFYEDNTAPTGYSLALVADAADGGYTPVFGYYDDNSVDVDATDTGSITEGESGLSPTPYSFKTDLVGWSSYQSSDTYEYTGVSDGSRTCYVKVRDNVYNEGSEQTVGVIVDIDNPSGYTLTFARHTGWSNGYHMYLSGSIIYFGSSFDDYFTVTGNNDGDPNNSGYQRIKFDTSSVFETEYSDYDPLPQSKDFYYQSDSSGSFHVDIINNAGNYQRFTHTATEDIGKPNSYVLSLDSLYHAPSEDVTVYGSTTDDLSGLLSSDCYEWWVNPTRDYGTSWTSTGQKTWSGITYVYPIFYAAAWDNVGNWRNASAIMGSFFQIVFITDPQPEIEVTEYYNEEDVYYEDLPLKIAFIEPEKDESWEEIVSETDAQIPEEIFYDETRDTKPESNNETDRSDESLNIITIIIGKTGARWVLPSIFLLIPIILILRKRKRKKEI